MKQQIRFALSIITTILLISTGCKTTSYSSALKNENADISIEEKMDVISYSFVKRQQVPTFSERASASRGLVFGPLLGTAVSIATNAVKKMIANDRAKYIANYTYGLNDLYFYDQLSLESVFDPVGLQFNGFTLVRTFLNKEGLTDTAFIARFELDTSSASEIINNSIFRLTLKELKLLYSKTKMTKAQQNTINMDIEISFRTSYVNELGQLFDNVELGKFYLLLRKAPMDKNSNGYAEYYDKLKGTRLDGRSFIVPRSFGYYNDMNGNVGKSYSQGAYSISVKVTESATDKFVTKVLSDNSSQIIDMIGTGAKNALSK